VETLELATPSDAWARLALDSGNIFATQEWHRRWWADFGLGRDKIVAVDRAEADGPEALVALFRWRRRPLSVVRFVGHGPADALGPVCAPEDLEAGSALLETALQNLPWRWDLFLADDIPARRPLSLRNATLVREEASPVSTLGSLRIEDVLAPAGDLVSQSRRKERALRTKHGATFRTATAATLEGDLDAFFRLHESRWSGSSSVTEAEEFHRAFARDAMNAGWLRLRLLEVEEKPVAVWWGYLFGGIASYYQAGRDRAWDRYSVGTVLLVHSIEQAHAEGALEYRFLRGGEDFKRRFASDDDPIATWIVPRVGALAPAVRAAGAVAPHMRPLVRRWYQRA
jgi:CelD/BcsL family acetyltransferase involved in cellulose biosynthesis